MRRRLFHLPGRPEKLAEDVDAEIRLHLDLRAAELMGAGMSREHAEREALRRFGPFDSARSQLLSAAQHRERRLTMLDRLDAIRHDLAFATRQLRRAPTIAAAVALTFALGIGANATMFGIIDRLLLRPPAHVASPDQVVIVGTRAVSGGDDLSVSSFSYPAFLDIRNQASGFAYVAMQTSPSPVSLGLGESARPVDHVLVSGEYFQLMGVRLAAGRPILPDDNELPDGQAVAVIGYGLWQREFGGEPSAIGGQIVLAQRTYTIVGVTPAGFTGVQSRPIDVWLPVAAAEGLRFGGRDWATARESQWMMLIGRLAPGATREQVTAQVTAGIRAGREIQHGRPDSSRAVLTSVLPTEQSRLTPEKKVALLLGAVSLMVLLIACANVANLLLLRAITRRREIAVRLALGISRARLMRQLVLEGTLLALIGGTAALLVVHYGSVVVQRALLSQYAWPDSAVDGRTVWFMVLATLLVGLLAGLVPAFHASAPDLTSTLKEGTRGSGFFRSKLRSTLLAAQTAIAVVLLVGTGLFVRSLQRVHAIDPGMDIDRVVIGTIDLRSVGLNAVQSKEYFSRAVAAVRRVPHVTNAVVAEGAPFTSWTLGIGVHVPGRDSVPSFQVGPYRHMVMPGYFRTVGTRIVRGRDFNEAEATEGGEKVAIMNEGAARLIWPNEDPVGQCVRPARSYPDCLRIVGLAADTHLGSMTEHRPAAQIYLAYGAWPTTPSAAEILVRVSDDPLAAIDPIRRAMQTAMPGLPFARVEPMTDRIGAELRPWRLGASLFGVFGLIAIVLSAMGLYSVVAYSVAQRTYEMGVRVALGARSVDIRRLVLLHGLRLAAIGAAVGMVVALAAGRYVEPLLYNTSPRDPAILVGAIALLLAVALLASLAPAHRAMRASPMAALRAE